MRHRVGAKCFGAWLTSSIQYMMACAITHQTTDHNGAPHSMAPVATLTPSPCHLIRTLLYLHRAVPFGRRRGRAVTVYSAVTYCLHRHRRNARIDVVLRAIDTLAPSTAL
ncbi:hypothetical protein BJY52DRAFT_1294613, partial [Lactarius psammicola]